MHHLQHLPSCDSNAASKLCTVEARSSERYEHTVLSAIILDNGNLYLGPQLTCTVHEQVYRQHSMDRFDVHKPHHVAASQTVGEPLPGESPSERSGLPSAQIGCLQAEPPGKAESMAGQVEGLQAVLQDSSAALQQELMTAEARMEVCFLDSLLSCRVGWSGIIHLPTAFVLILCLMYQRPPRSPRKVCYHVLKRHTYSPQIGSYT